MCGAPASVLAAGYLGPRDSLAITNGFDYSAKLQPWDHRIVPRCCVVHAENCKDVGEVEPDALDPNCYLARRWWRQHITDLFQLFQVAWSLYPPNLTSTALIAHQKLVRNFTAIEVRLLFHARTNSLSRFPAPPINNKRFCFLPQAAATEASEEQKRLHLCGRRERNGPGPDMYFSKNWQLGPLRTDLKENKLKRK